MPSTTHALNLDAHDRRALLSLMARMAIEHDIDPGQMTLAELAGDIIDLEPFEEALPRGLEVFGYEYDPDAEMAICEATGGKGRTW